MNAKINYEIEPLFASNEEKEKGLCDGSWVLVSATTNENIKIFFFNESLNPEEYKDFKNFVESNIDDFSCPGDCSEPNKIMKENYACISSFSGTIEEDYDEDSKKTFKVGVGQAAIMEFFKGGIKLDKIQELVTKVEKHLIELEKDGAYQITENNSYKSGQHGYNRLNRKDY